MSLVSGFLPELCLGQGRVDRANRFEVTANEENMMDRQDSQLPCPGDLLFEDLAHFAQALLRDAFLDSADCEMGGVWTRLRFEAYPLL